MDIFKWLFKLFSSCTLNNTNIFIFNVWLLFIVSASLLKELKDKRTTKSLIHRKSQMNEIVDQYGGQVYICFSLFTINVLKNMNKNCKE